MNTWVFSQIVGDDTPPAWFSDTEPITGPYLPQAPATGVATVTAG